MLNERQAMAAMGKADQEPNVDESKSKFRIVLCGVTVAGGFRDC